MSQSIPVSLGSRSYVVEVGEGLLASTDLPALVPGRHALIVTDENVAPLYLGGVHAAISGKSVHTVVMPAGEQEKNLGRFAQLMQALSSLGASRDVTVIALGGGVIGDLAGFAAACWMRGVRFVQIPTTLLAMVDSSVGGKTAVDLPSGKNLVGAFHQPAAVIADISTLSTLPERELRAGLAEVLKYGAIGDPAFFAWLETHADALLAREPFALETAIATSVRHKAGVVARDETEQGERMLLNFGHTFGHAIETEQAYGGLLHGEAVALGMLLAARLSAQLGRAPMADAQRLQALLQRFGLPTTLPAGLSSGALVERMRLDKKAVSGRLRLILWRELGHAVVVADIPEAAIAAVFS